MKFRRLCVFQQAIFLCFSTKDGSPAVTGKSVSAYDIQKEIVDRILHANYTTERMVTRMDYQRACSCHNMRAGSMGVTQGGLRKRQDMRVMEPHSKCTPSGEYPPNFCDYPSLAMAYLPYQKWDDLYEPAEALQNATLFRELNKPFLAGRRGGNGSI